MLTLSDKFTVRAPKETVWEFLMDPRKVVPCMPGAHLDDIESETTFTGGIRISVGPFKTSYRGRVTFTEVDLTDWRVHMVAEGHESGSGSARGWMVSSLREVEGGTEVVVDAWVEGTSRLIGKGLRFGENIGHELFGQFVASLKEKLEPGAVHEPRPSEVEVVPLLVKAFARRFKKRPAKA
jgi:carbon monoxide dehydrogenase subunit G